MLWLKSESFFDALLETLQRLTWQSVHEVQADVVESVILQKQNRFSSSVCIVTTVEQFQFTINQTLNAKAYAVDAGGKCRKIILRDVVGIHFHGQLLHVPNVKVLAEAIEDSMNFRRA